MWVAPCAAWPSQVHLPAAQTTTMWPTRYQHSNDCGNARQAKYHTPANQHGQGTRPQKGPQQYCISNMHIIEAVLHAPARITIFALRKQLCQSLLGGCGMCATWLAIVPTRVLLHCRGGGFQPIHCDLAKQACPYSYDHTYLKRWLSQ